VLDSEEHQWTPPDQTYDIIFHLAYDSTGLFGLSLRVVSTELFDCMRENECVVLPGKKKIIFSFCFILFFISRQ
jgi:hypothetical protein